MTLPVVVKAQSCPTCGGENPPLYFIRNPNGASMRDFKPWAVCRECADFYAVFDWDFKHQFLPLNAKGYLIQLFRGISYAVKRE